MSKEDKVRYRHLIHSVKEDIKNKNDFDLNKLPDKDQKLIKSRMKYNIKNREKIENIGPDEQNINNEKVKIILLLEKR
jgi:hypothetical protein